MVCIFCAHTRDAITDIYIVSIFFYTYIHRDTNKLAFYLPHKYTHTHKTNGNIYWKDFSDVVHAKSCLENSQRDNNLLFNQTVMRTRKQFMDKHL